MSVAAVRPLTRAIIRPAPLLAALAAVAWVLLAWAAPARAAPTFPTLTGRVVDDAHVLSPTVQADLTQRLAALETTNSRQLIVVTVPSLQGYDIADYGYQLGRAWGIGQKGINNGALFIVAPSEHKVRIEVGYGLEGILTDAETSVILQRAVLPRFRAGDVPGGVQAGTQAIIDQLAADPSTAEQHVAQAASQRQASAYRGHRGSPLGAIIAFVAIVWVIGGVLGGRGRGGVGWFLPGVILGGLMGGGRRGDEWDDGGGGGGFGGGGGGSFGGGGSSGSW